MSALLAINKPVGPTSHDVLQTLRRITGEKRIGHAGTLDPLASGVLVVGIGRDATKQLDEAVQKEKEYLATITLGETSTTDDAEGLITKYQSPITNHQLPITKQPTKKEVAVVLKEFIGSIKQVPPPYSAVKIRGQEAYKRARRGEKLNMPPRDVDIFSIELISYDYPTLVL
ncbi:MAG: tRNA pseudouridine(55) synthase TruB, partial [Candidatus Buchananbacteria bacterium RIFCSPHIGHO2_01_FULL_47_11b]